MAIIIAPNEKYTGISATVPFIRGKGETGDPKLIEWFKRKGYKVLTKAEANAEATAKTEKK